MVKARLSSLQDRISQICRRLDRDPAEVTLIGVTKYAALDSIREALACGLSHIGENKVQDAKEKFVILEPVLKNVTKHMIGHLQSNKVKTALQIFDLIHSVDSLHLAEAVEKEAVKLGKTADILVQVNTSGEAQKSGVTRDAALQLMDAVSRLEHVRVHGLMTMAPLTEAQGVVRKTFSDLREIRDAVKTQFVGHPRVEMRYLSMGMTQDFEIALEEGSNMIRVGTAIFGEKK